MVSHGRLVLKLPSDRVAELIGTGRGDPFDAGKGRPMMEWVGFEPSADEDWLGLATEALAFVRPGRLTRDVTTAPVTARSFPTRQRVAP